MPRKRQQNVLQTTTKSGASQMEPMTAEYPCTICRKLRNLVAALAVVATVERVGVVAGATVAQVAIVEEHVPTGAASMSKKSPLVHLPPIPARIPPMAQTLTPVKTTSEAFRVNRGLWMMAVAVMVIGRKSLSKFAVEELKPVEAAMVLAHGINRGMEMMAVAVMATGRKVMSVLALGEESSSAEAAMAMVKARRVNRGVITVRLEARWEGCLRRFRRNRSGGRGDMITPGGNRLPGIHDISTSGSTAWLGWKRGAHLLSEGFIFFYPYNYFTILGLEARCALGSGRPLRDDRLGRHKAVAEEIESLRRPK